jgi:hypothetical protein
MLSAACRRGYVHICDWEMSPRAWPDPVFMRGPGEACPYPTKRPSGKPALSSPPDPSTAPILPELRAFFDLLDALRDGASTCDQLVDDTGLSIISVRRVISMLHKTKQVHIVGWTYASRGAIYSLGRGKDVPRPGRKPAVFVNADYRQKRAVREATRAMHRAMSAPNEEQFAQQA